MGAYLDSSLSTYGEKMTSVVTKQFHKYSIVSLWIISTLTGN